MGENTRNKRKCSFCGRPESEVGLLITGMNGYICDSCSQQAYEIVKEAMNSPVGSSSLDLKELPKPTEIKAFLDQYVIGQDDAKRYLSVAHGKVVHPCKKQLIKYRHLERSREIP